MPLFSTSLIFHFIHGPSSSAILFFAPFLPVHPWIFLRYAHRASIFPIFFKFCSPQRHRQPLNYNIRVATSSGRCFYLCKLNRVFCFCFFLLLPRDCLPNNFPALHRWSLSLPGFLFFLVTAFPISSYSYLSRFAGTSQTRCFCVISFGSLLLLF